MRTNAPTAVELSRFEGRARGRIAVLEWETVSEVGLAGFVLYRSTRPDGPYVQLNQELIPAQNPGTPVGAIYTWQDRGLRSGRTYYYRLEQVSVSGARTAYGPVKVTLRSRIGPRLLR